MTIDITTHERAEEAIQETNHTLQAFMQAAPLAIIALDADGRVTMWNSAAERIFGWNEEEVLGHHLPFVSDNKQEVFLTLCKRALSGESFMGIEVRQQKRDGSQIDISISAAPVRNVQGNIKAVIGVVDDVTERKRTQAVEALLYEVDRLVLQGRTLDFILSHVCKCLVDILAYPLVCICMKEEDGSVGISAQGGTHVVHLRNLHVLGNNASECRCPAILAIRKGYTPTSDMREPAFLQHRERSCSYELQSFVSLPLCTQGKILGTLNLYALKPNTFDAKTVRLLENLAKRISAALLMAIDQQILHLQGTAMASMSHAVFITDCKGRIKWVNKAFTLLSGYPAEEVYGQTPSLFKSGKHDTSFYQSIWQTILSGEVWRGEIVNRRKDGGLYTVEQTITPLRDMQGKVVHFVAIHQDITDKKQSEAHIHYLAYYDTLTNLPNRSLFCDRLQHELAHAHRNERMLAVMFLDLDRFKVINDTLGHTYGDQALKAVAERLKGCVRESDTISRWGGDEFIFIITNITQPQDVVFIAHKIFTEMSSPFQLEERKVYITPTIGIALYPLDASDAENLIKKADTAMYHGKERGRHTFKFYTQDYEH
ncbi:MAG TPA: diguanylate cyclase domain-containing protein [Candidatus Wunengus californicus]|uniref:diguanylate cyclase domain-containing protein n=1 Tax=Candidatus Wunengus californicus TaxID=3367619 RepID=UPI004029ECE4